MNSELFEFYTPTKDRLSKPMPEWIFHTEKGSEGEPRRIKERRKEIGGGKRQRDAGRHRKEEERVRGRGSEAMLACRRTLAALCSAP